MKNDVTKVPKVLGDSGLWDSKRRGEVLELFTHEMYGQMHYGEYEKAYSLLYTEQVKVGKEKALKTVMEVTVVGINGKKTFPFVIWQPAKSGQYPTHLHLSNHDNVEMSWLFQKNCGWRQEENLPPLELLLQNKRAFVLCLATDIEPDNGVSFPCGLARILEKPQEKRNGDSIGCISVWALGLRIIIDYLVNCSFVIKERIIVSGFSRFGKAALWCGANDERVYCTVSFSSGCGGAALSRDSKAETVGNLLHNFPHWLCDNMKKYIDRENELPFDQHMLLALIAPRLLYVASSSKDIYSDIQNEFLSCVLAKDAYQACGESGIEMDLFPEVGIPLHNGCIGYHLREGEHKVTTYDWELLLDFLVKKRVDFEESFRCVESNRQPRN